MTSHKSEDFSSSVTLKWLFHFWLLIKCHQSANPSPPTCVTSLKNALFGNITIWLHLKIFQKPVCLIVWKVWLCLRLLLAKFGYFWQKFGYLSLWQNWKERRKKGAEFYSNKKVLNQFEKLIISPLRYNYFWFTSPYHLIAKAYILYIILKFWLPTTAIFSAYHFLQHL